MAVVHFMLHGPCNEKCLDEEGHCKHGYRKSFLDETSWQGESRIEYRRRNNGITFVNKNGFVFDNRDVVPYNRYLLLRYQCHMNVLICTTKISSIRYLFSYTTKGVNMATLKATFESCGCDEVQRYVNGRYISAPEAFWRLFQFSILEISPSTM